MRDMNVTVASCEFTYAKEVTKALLHAVLFHRLFGQVVPRTHELLDLTVPQVDDAEVEAVVEGRAAAYVKALRDADSAPVDREHLPAVVVEFYEKRTRKAWFSRAEEEVCWESWTVRVLVVPASRTEAERKANLRSLERELESAIRRILTYANDRNDEYLPPIPYTEGHPFPYQISVR